jgi:small subunit ribosomal protein S5
MKAITKMTGKRAKVDASELALEEKLLGIDRITKVVKGGKHLRFRALVIVGDKERHVGFGLAKATEVPEAIRKAGAAARKELLEVPNINGTIPHEVLAKFGASKILLKPATPGTGLVASNTARTVLELAGIRDILSKSLGSSNKVNVVKATMLALANLKKPEVLSAPKDLEAEIQGETVNEAE